MYRASIFGVHDVGQRIYKQRVLSVLLFGDQQDNGNGGRPGKADLPKSVASALSPLFGGVEIYLLRAEWRDPGGDNRGLLDGERIIERGKQMESFCHLIETIFRTLVNDKVLVILCVTSISIISIFKMPDKADTIILASLSGLFGVAVGAGLTRRTSDSQAPPVNGKPPEGNEEKKP